MQFLADQAWNMYNLSRSPPGFTAKLQKVVCYDMRNENSANIYPITRLLKSVWKIAPRSENIYVVLMETLSMEHDPAFVEDCCNEKDYIEFNYSEVIVSTKVIKKLYLSHIICFVTQSSVHVCL